MHHLTERRAGRSALKPATPRVSTQFAFACLLTLPTSTALAASNLDTRIAECTQLVNAEARLACFDTLAAERIPADAGAAKKEATFKKSRLVISAPTAPTSEPMTASTAPDAGATAISQPAKTLPPTDRRNSLGVRLYKPNYILPVTYNDSRNENSPRGDAIEFLGNKFDDFEIKFQLSFEVPLWTNILNRNLDLYFGYTQVAFFQAYNKKYSSPFRDTNYEPEIGLHWAPHWQYGDFKLTSLRAAIDHQSNGRSEPLSRSWNRMVGQIETEYRHLDLALRFWAPLGNKHPPDNPRIYDYLGYGELHAGYDWGNHHFGMMLRNPAHPAVQLDWSYPLGQTVSLYVQYFNGYGESLLDYDHSVNRIGIGFKVNNWP